MFVSQTNEIGKRKMIKIIENNQIIETGSREKISVECKTSDSGTRLWIEKQKHARS